MKIVPINFRLRLRMVFLRSGLQKEEKFERWGDLQGTRKTPAPFITSSFRFRQIPIRRSAQALCNQDSSWETKMRILKISTLMIACAAGALTLSPVRAESGGKDEPQARMEKMCSDQGSAGKFAEFQAHRAEHVAEALKLTDAQKAAFKDLEDVRAKAHADAHAALCASKPDMSTFEKRLAFREGMMQRRLDTFKVVEPKLIAFYNSLDDGQKREFEHMMQHMKHKMMEHGWGHHGEGEGWGHHHHGGDDE
jgi:hypothetical protein